MAINIPSAPKIDTVSNNLTGFSSAYKNATMAITMQIGYIMKSLTSLPFIKLTAKIMPNATKGTTITKILLIFLLKLKTLTAPVHLPIIIDPQ